jgi:hypothetical protein
MQVLARHGALGPAEIIASQDSRWGRDVDQIYVVEFIRTCDLYQYNIGLYGRSFWTGCAVRTGSSAT